MSVSIILISVRPKGELVGPVFVTYIHLRGPKLELVGPSVLVYYHQDGAITGASRPLNLFPTIIKVGFKLEPIE